MPASIAESITFLVFSRSSRLPKLLHPRPSAETMRPVLPNARLIMGFSDRGEPSTRRHSQKCPPNGQGPIACSEMSRQGNGAFIGERLSSSRLRHHLDPPVYVL